MAEIRLLVRRDTATNWATNDPTPFAGEWTLETDTGVVKLGDGSTAYSSLPEFGAGSIKGSITDNQIAVGAATADEIEGSATLTYDATYLKMDDVAPFGLMLTNTSSGTNAKKFSFDNYLGIAGIRFWNDAESSPTELVTYQRSGTTATTITHQGNNFVFFPDSSDQGFEIYHNVLTLGDAFSASTTRIENQLSQDTLQLRGGSSNFGSFLQLNGSSATNANDITLGHGSNLTIFSYDYSIGQIELRSGGATPAVAVTIDSSQHVTFFEKAIFDASTTADPSLNIPEGVAPTTPVDGDVWVTAAGEFFAHLNGVSVDLAAGGGGIGGSITDNQIAVGAATANDIEGSANLTWNGTLLNVTGALTVTGAFTSVGIDDNATGEAFQLADILATWGQAGTTYTHAHVQDTSAHVFSGGTDATIGGNLAAFGSTHATLAGDLWLRSSANKFMVWDESAGSLTFSTGSGAKTDILVLDSSQDALFSGNVGVGGTAIPVTTSSNIIWLDSDSFVQGSNDAIKIAQLGSNIYLDTTWRHLDENPGAVLNVGAGNIRNYIAATPAVVAATALVASTEYRILTVGTTDFTLVGAASNTVGELFTATGAGTGTGTASEAAASFVLALDIDETDSTFNNNVTITGTFNSLGIDDNATAERAQISDTEILVGGAAADYILGRAISTDRLFIAGGTATNDGGNIVVYGGSHATFAGDVAFRSAGNIWGQWDEDAGTFTVYTGTGAKTQALLLDAAQDATFSGNITLQTGNIVLQNNRGIYLDNLAGTAQLALHKFTDDHVYLDNKEATGSLILRSGGSTTALTLDSSQNATFAGNITSKGIDDNATGERIQIGDANMVVGTASTNYIITKPDTAAGLIIGGGNNAADGADLVLYGSTHVTTGDFILRSGGNEWLLWDESLGQAVLSTGTGAKTTALTLDSSQNATFAGDISVTGGNITAGNSGTGSQITLDGPATGNPLIELMQNAIQRAYMQYLDSGDILRIDSDGRIQLYSSNALALTCETNQNVTIANAIDIGQSIRLLERADHAFTPTATFGEIWVRNDVPNKLIFTDDAGTDHDLTAASQFLSENLVVKTADESVTNSTTLQDDNDLSVSLDANSYYKIVAHLWILNSSSTPDFKYDWVEADGTWVNLRMDGGNEVSRGYQSASSGAITLIGTIPEAMLFEFVVATGGTGGTFKLQWAQNTLDAVNATTVKAGSYMHVQKMA